jgi:Tfp pilus assembly protein PilF
VSVVDPSRRSRLLLPGLAVAFVAAHVLAAFAGGDWWGLHHLRYLDAAEIVGTVIASVALAGAVAAALRREPGARSASSPLRFAAVLALGFAALWIFRDRSHLLGDGSVILQGIADASPYHGREPLSAFALHAAQALGARAGLPPVTSLELTSCGLGVLLLAMLTLLDGALKAGGVVIALTFLTGAAQLFFGYVEHYPTAALAVAAFLIAARSPATRPAPLLPCLVLFALALLSHLSSIVLAPALLYVIARQIHVRPTTGARLLAAGEAAVAAALTLGVWRLAFGGVDDAPSLAGYLAQLRDAAAYTYAPTHERSPGLAPGLWSVQHLSDFVNLQLLLVPVALPAAAFALARAPRALLADPWRVVLALASVAYLGAQFQFFPYLGAPRDWDVLAVGALPVGLLAATGLPLATGSGGWRRTAAVVAGLSAFHTLPWILGNADPEAADRRFAELRMPPGQVSFVLGAEALREGRPEDAADWLRKAVEEVPQAAPAWYSLGVAYQTLERWDEARDAFARALALRAVDLRAPKGELLERLGLVSWRTGRTDEARAVFREALRERPGSISARVFLAIDALDAGRAGDAWALLEPVLDRGDENAMVLLLAARALEETGRPEEAAALLREATGRFPTDPAVRAAVADFERRRAAPR